MLRKTVSRAQADELLTAGWRIIKDGKSGVQLGRTRPHDELLENSIWSILYHMGYHELNRGRDFKIEIYDKDSKIIYKQIDVFARDEHTIVVVECKSAASISSRSMQKDIAEFANNRDQLSKSIRRHYGTEWKPKIIWILATRNIRWSVEDLTRAKAEKIHLIRDNEIRYYTEISRTLEGASRYQFQAEFLGNQNIPSFGSRKVPAIKIKLGGKTAYNFSIKAEDLLSISFVNHRDLRDPAGTPSYQRLIKIGRLKSLRKFIMSGGFFPNSIIVSFRRKPRFDPIGTQLEKEIQIGHLELPDKYKSCWIVDGQHRLYGCGVISSGFPTPMLSVIGFDNITPDKEAELFATVNREQKQVPPKLLDELDGDLKWDSPIKKDQLAAVASRAVNQLRFEVGGPFFDRVASPGFDSNTEQSITFPEIRKAIVGSGLIGREYGYRKLYYPGGFSGATNADTLNFLVEGLNYYFSKLRDANEERWDRGRAGYVCTNFGVPGHIRFMGETLRKLEAQDNSKAVAKSPQSTADAVLACIPQLLDFIKTATDEEFEERFKVNFGAGGVKEYVERIRSFSNN